MNRITKKLIILSCMISILMGAMTGCKEYETQKENNNTEITGETTSEKSNTDSEKSQYHTGMQMFQKESNCVWQIQSILKK